MHDSNTNIEHSQVKPKGKAKPENNKVTDKKQSEETSMTSARKKSLASGIYIIFIYIYIIFHTNIICIYIHYIHKHTLYSYIQEYQE